MKTGEKKKKQRKVFDQLALVQTSTVTVRSVVRRKPPRARWILPSEGGFAIATGAAAGSISGVAAPEPAPEGAPVHPIKKRRERRLSVS